MKSDKSFIHVQPVTKDRAKALVASGLQRAVLNHGLEAVAAAATCSPRCLQKALSHETLPEMHTIANVLRIDQTALGEFFSAFGFRLTPDNTEACPDMRTVSDMSRAVSEFVKALEDGARNHQETMKLASLFRPLIARMSAIVHEADGLRSVA